MTDVTLRHPDGASETIGWLSAAALLILEMPFSDAWRTAQDLRDAQVFTAYGFRDGRMLYADPQGITQQAALADAQRAVRAAGEVA